MTDDLDDFLGLTPAPPPAPPTPAPPPTRRARGRAAADPDATARLKHAQAEWAEIKAARLRGELVPVGEVQAAWAAILADVRAGVLAIPHRLPGLAPDMAAALDRELRAALERLADDPATATPPPRATTARRGANG